jgi:Methyltransferase domain
MTIKLGGYHISEDWPVRGEAGRTFREKLNNGFFSAYMAGEVIIDVGFRGGHGDAVPILPHAIGVDLDFPGYDGTRLPFTDESVDTVYSSHMLEHVPDYRATMRDWQSRRENWRVHRSPPISLREEAQPAFPPERGSQALLYPPATLLGEFETSLEQDTYRVGHLRDSDENYTHHTGLEAHAGGGYEIELVVQRIDKPPWHLPSGRDALAADLTASRDEVARTAAGSRSRAHGGSMAQS